MKYSLQSLMIAVLLAGPACGFGWKTWTAWQDSRRQQCPGTLRQIGIGILTPPNSSAPAPNPPAK